MGQAIAIVGMACRYPDARSGPKRLYFMLAGLVLGFLGSFLWVSTRAGIRTFITEVRSVSARDHTILG